MRLLVLAGIALGPAVPTAHAVARPPPPHPLDRVLAFPAPITGEAASTARSWSCRASMERRAMVTGIITPPVALIHEMFRLQEDVLPEMDQ